MRRTLAPLAAVTLTLTGCGPSQDAHYESPEDLRNILDDSGIECIEKEDNIDTIADSLTCRSGHRIFTWEEGNDEAFPSVMRANAEREHYVVESETWAISVAQQGGAADAQELLGGTIHEKDAHLEYVSNLWLSYEACGTDDQRAAYDDDYEVLTIRGAYRHGLAGGSEYECVAEELPIPEHVQDDIGRTRALDGTRDADWDNFSASWTYHPDTGLNLQIEGAEQNE